jgi:Poly(ADP-ribose) polymerase catalytic domain/WWE domain
MKASLNCFQLFFLQHQRHHHHLGLLLQVRCNQLYHHSNTMPSKKGNFVEILHNTGRILSSHAEYKDKWSTVLFGSDEGDDIPCNIVWAWEEDVDGHREHKASLQLVGKPPFVKYTCRVSRDIEKLYQIYLREKGKDGESAAALVDLPHKTPKLRKQKRHGQQYQLNFRKMVQINKISGYERPIVRLLCWAKDHGDAMFGLPKYSTLENLTKSSFLPTYRGQIIQVTKNKGGSQWHYGKVLHDPKNDGRERTEGWFPAILGKPARISKIHELCATMSSLNIVPSISILPPEHWTRPRTWRTDWPRRVNLSQGSDEFSEVKDYFLNSFGPGYEEWYNIVKIERIQLLEKWQNYQVTKDRIQRQYSEDGKYNVELTNNTFENLEKKWLFHGTDGRSAKKIAKTGMKMLCVGVNGSNHGKGLYFAESVQTSMPYSTSNDLYIKKMFLCRVAVGDWCKGRSDQIMPDPKPGSSKHFFDSVVDDCQKPKVYVVYNEAQIYPEYLVTFEERCACCCNGQ